MPVRIGVVGGGVIGLSCAWVLARAGHDVVLIAPDAGLTGGRPGGASWVAAGMLAPVTEAQFGEAPLTTLLLEGAARWKEFATTLEAATGHDIGFDQSGTVTVALTPSDRAVLDDLLRFQQDIGCTVHRRTASECRALVPSLAPGISGGLEVPGDHQVDNRALLGALAAGCAAAGVEFVVDTVAGVAAVAAGPELSLFGGSRIRCDVAVLAAGIGTPGLSGLGGAELPEIRPVKGHIMRLGPTPARGSARFLDRTVRGLVHGRSVYLVPRQDGTVVVGATVEERGLDTTVQAGAIHQLLSDARAIIPAIDELELLETAAGLRPATPDNTPCIGWTKLPGVAVASGHFRNGILLAPLTAAAMVALLEGGTGRGVFGGEGTGA